MARDILAQQQVCLWLPYLNGTNELITSSLISVLVATSMAHTACLLICQACLLVCLPDEHACGKLSGTKKS
eukprot:1160817-Pelagomonas_calceolata.AAC.7